MTSISKRSRTAFRRSTLAGLLAAHEGSTILTAATAAYRSLITWVKASASYRTLNAHPAWWRASRLNSTLNTATTWARNAYLFRWLTAEPEPEVIVIDLRDTFTVGPFIEILDEVLMALTPAYDRSRLRSIGLGSMSAFQSAPIRVASFLGLGLSFIWLGTQLTLDTPSVNGLLPPLLLAIIAALGTRVRWSTDDLAESRMGKIMISALEPPELAEENSEPLENDNDRPD